MATFYSKRRITVFTVQHIYIALYITHLLDKGSSSRIYSIKWSYKLHVHGFADNSYVKCLQEAAKRVATPKVTRKEYVHPDPLILLCDS